jgi:ribosomal protein S6
MFIVNPDMAEDDVTRLSESLTQIITDQGGTITKNENMGRRQLAYPIERRNEGNYVLLEIEGTGGEIAELERRMRVNDQVIRYLTVRVDEDRQRAEKFKAKRARRASKRPFSASAGERGDNAGGGALQSLIVISDDLALPFGQIRLRARGSAGGHNGLKSIIAATGTDEFIRLRIGLGADHPVRDTARFVLDEFTRTERAALDEVLERSAEALRVVIRDGIERAMAQYN